MTQKNKDILILTGGVIVLAAILIIPFLLAPKSIDAHVKVVTDKNQYKLASNLKVKIENDLKNNICFSSCYPYYLQRKDGKWDTYQYPDCSKENVAKYCLSPKEIKAFELKVLSTDMKKGVHRLAIPACVGCSLYDKFRKDKLFYSNNFAVD